MNKHLINSEVLEIFNHYMEENIKARDNMSNFISDFHSDNVAKSSKSLNEIIVNLYYEVNNIKNKVMDLIAVPEMIKRNHINQNEIFFSSDEILLLEEIFSKYMTYIKENKLYFLSLLEKNKVTIDDDIKDRISDWDKNIITINNICNNIRCKALEKVI